VDNVDRDRISVVGIGASAGGIDAFRRFFEHMPADSGLAFVVILHLPPDRKSLLADILGRFTRMPVLEAPDGCEIIPNRVFVPPPGVAVRLHDGRLYTQRTGFDEPRETTPIDVFFDSLAASLDDDAVGVVLSGTGSDGALGLKAIQARGGLTLAQQMDGGATQHGGMPASAISAGVVEIVAPVDDLAANILSVRHARLSANSTPQESAEAVEQARLRVCALLQRQVGHDFSGYKESTFLRRVQRRMQVLNVTTLDAYVSRLEHDAAEAVMLFRDLLIGVTGFFRDPDTFETVKRLIVPRLFAGKGADATVRIWVAGCATGEEAYSLAILMREYMDAAQGPLPHVQILATDIDDAAVTTARAGRYPATLLEGMSAARLSRFFVVGQSGYTVTKDVRELCTFSSHSLTRDPPYSRIDLVSCRNLLIYLDGELQKVVMPALHYALVPGGTLLLGSSESVAQHETLFATIDRKHRIFERRDTPTPPLRTPSKRNLPAGQHNVAATDGLDTNRRGIKVLNRASLRVLEHFAPAFVVISPAGEIAQYSSRTGKFLEAAPGLPNQNVFAMCRHGLQVPLRETLRQSIASGRTVERFNVPVSADEPGDRITLVVDPMPDQGTTALYLVLFIEARQGGPSPPERAPDVPAAADEPDDPRLEYELRDAQEQLRLLIDEHGTALEELTSANEELRSLNEEFQSTNEELETSKEEIQSINEELQTVNSQLSAKLEELDGKNSDLQNLFESTQVATLFLDPYQIIRGFTPAVAGIYNLIPSDIGRPLSDIVSQLRYHELNDDVGQVLNTLQPLDRRLSRLDDTAHYLMRILPYRTPDSTVSGTVITFVDVTSIVQAEQHQRLLVDELNHRVKNMLTVVISMAIQTLRRSTSLADFSENYLGRIHSLAGAYSLLTSQSWQTVPLRDLLNEELRAFSSFDRDNVWLEGPPVSLLPRAALALGMAVHELATNAVKYGALSAPLGAVRISWRVEHESDQRYFVLEWVEADGPPVSVPTHRGLGMTLIERGLAADLSAHVTVEFAPEGVRAIVRAPYDLLSSAGAS
jgi:two-component system, chemotaxis family, CheB/CheR fusion protein